MISLLIIYCSEHSCITLVTINTFKMQTILKRIRHFLFIAVSFRTFLILSRIVRGIHELTVNIYNLGERPYMCNFCGRGFCESGNLKKHLRVHGKDIPAVIRQNNKGRGAERQDLREMDKIGGVPGPAAQSTEAEPKEEVDQGNVSYEEQVSNYSNQIY